MTSAVVLSGTVVPYAETTTTSTLDESQTGSITLYKLVSEDGKHNTGTGLETDLDAAQVGKQPLAGVGFDYLKIGELEQVTGTQAGADNTLTGVYYVLDEGFVAQLGKSGITPKATIINGKNYYTAEDVNAALKALNTSTVGYDDSNNGSGAGNEMMNKYVDQNGTAMPKTDSAGKTSVSNLELGLYIVCEVETPASLPDGVTEAVARPSRPFLVALPMTNISEVDGHPAGTVWQYDVTAYPKNEMINIRKDIIVDGNDGNDDACGADNLPGCGDGLLVTTDKNVGDYVNFLLTFDVPKLQPQADGVQNTNRKYVIEDTMTDGLTLDSTGEDNFKVTVGTNPYNSDANDTLTHGDDYTVTLDSVNNKFTVALTSAGLAKLDQKTTDVKLYVNYKARLNEKAADVTGGIKEEGNVTKLTYGTSVSEDRVFDSNPDVKTYTYEININKTFTSAVEDKSKVAFSIDSSTPEGKEVELEFVKESDGVYHLFDGKETDARTKIVNVNKDGKLTLKGLDARTYVLTEEDTVGGYNLMRDPITIEFSKHSPEDGTIANATIQSGNDDAVEITTGLANGTVNFEIRNNETIDMLHTGGEGFNPMLTVAGVAIVAAGGAVFFFCNKKKKENEEAN